jgi:peroxiredoxin
LRDWHTQYHNQGLIVIGVHSPEFDYEKQADGVSRAIKELNVPYAVALDNDFKIWNAFKVWAWPSMYILDKQGRIRFTHVGEGAYRESEQTIQQLLKEN